MLLNQDLLTYVSIGLQADLTPKNEPKQAKKYLPNWPNTLAGQVSAVAQRLSTPGAALSLADLEASFKGQGPWKKGLPRILETLEALGRARREGDGWR